MNIKNLKSLLLSVIIVLILISASVLVIHSDKIFNQKTQNIKDIDKKYNNTCIIKKEITFSDPTIIKNKDFIKIEVENSNSYFTEIGKPRLPILSTIIEFPIGTKIIDVAYKTIGINNLSLDKRLVLSPLPYSKKIDMSIIVNKAEEEQKKGINKPYPEKWYSYKTGGGLSNDKHTAFLLIYSYPVRYIESENKLQYAKKAEIKITYIEGNKSIVKNQKYDLLIITHNDFYNDLKPLVDHKNNIGINTTIVSLDSILTDKIMPNEGRDNPEKIKYFIKDAIESFGIKYVLLVGDKNKIESRMNHIILPNSIPLPSFSDLYYADIYDSEGNFSSWDINNNNIFAEYNWEWNSDLLDFYSDIYLGRLPCKDNEEVRIVVNKIINYEKTSYNKEWLNNLIICAGDTFLPKEYLLRLPVVNSLKSSDILLSEGEYVGDKIEEIMSNYNVKKLYSSQILPQGNKKSLTHLNIAREINKGASFVIFIGHGNYKAWATYKTLISFLRFPLSGYTISDILLLNNKEKLPVFIFDACYCGGFTGEEDCLAWEVVKFEKGGAIASFGFIPFSFSYLGEENIFLGLNSYMDISYFSAYQSGKNILGKIWANTLNDYLHYHSNMNSIDFNNVEGWVLLGDPSLKVGGYSN